MTTRRLVLLRHGQTEHNADSRMQGQLDTELSDLGRAQARRVADLIAALNPRLLVSSDLRRARDTAVAVGEACGMDVRTDPRLRETYLGDWQGHTHQEVDSAYPGARKVWRADANWAPPGGESRVQVAARAVPLVQELEAELPDWGRRPVVLIAHGGVIAALTATLLDLPVTHWPVIGGIGSLPGGNQGSVASLYAAADKALYDAKRLGRDRVERVEPDASLTPSDFQRMRR